MGRPFEVTSVAESLQAQYRTTAAIPTRFAFIRNVTSRASFSATIQPANVEMAFGRNHFFRLIRRHWSLVIRNIRCVRWMTIRKTSNGWRRRMEMKPSVEQPFTNISGYFNRIRCEVESDWDASDAKKRELICWTRTQCDWVERPDVNDVKSLAITVSVPR